MPRDYAIIRMKAVGVRRVLDGDRYADGFSGGR